MINILMRRIVITGIGALSPIGNSFRTTWEGVKSGLSGIGSITRFDASGLPWKMAGELKGFDAGAFLPAKEINRLDPFVQYAVAASLMAAEDAGLIKQPAVKEVEKLRRGEVKDSMASHINSPLVNAGVVIGSSRGGVSTIERSLLRTRNSKLKTQNLRLSPYIMPSTTISMAASYIALRLGIKGHCLGISNACASGANAVGEAFRMIKAGYLDLAIAGGTEAPICRLCIEGYGISGASARHKRDYNQPRPFSAERDGFVLAEGACVMVLEEYGHALKRGAAIYGEVAGYGNTTDACHMTQPDPDGEAMAIKKALEEAGLSPEDIGHISTHGTATRIGDIAETAALKTVFDNRASLIPSTAVKSMTGHMLAASGALEVGLALMSIRENIIPPTLNIGRKDPECDLNIADESRGAEINAALSNSFGFGGVNAVIVLRDHISFS